LNSQKDANQNNFEQTRCKTAEASSYLLFTSDEVETNNDTSRCEERDLLLTNKRKEGRCCILLVWMATTKFSCTMLSSLLLQRQVALPF
jgi:hypothetical protein